MKILFLTDSLKRGGKERQLTELIKGLRIKNISCELVVFNRNIGYEEINNTGIKIYFLIRKSRKDIRIFFKLYKLCKKINPDIIHCWDSMSVSYALPSVKLLKIKIIDGSIRYGTIIPRSKKLAIFREKYIFPYVDKVVSNSIAGLHAHKLNLSSKYICIYNGFDFSRIANLKSKNAVRIQYGIGNQKVVGMVASFSDAKDYKTYIKAALNILKTKNDIMFFCVGEGKNLSNCKQIIPHKFNENFVFTGIISDIESVINIFDIGVLSTYSEGISNTILEYMALGKPVIASGKGGTKEIIENGKNGFLIPSENHEILAEKIYYLLDNDDIRNKKGLKSKKIVKEKFSYRKMVNNFVELYKETIKGSHY